MNRHQRSTIMFKQVSPVLQWHDKNVCCAVCPFAPFLNSLLGPCNKLHILFLCLSRQQPADDDAQAFFVILQSHQMASLDRCHKSLLRYTSPTQKEMCFLKVSKRLHKNIKKQRQKFSPEQFLSYFMSLFYVNYYVLFELLIWFACIFV